MELQGSQFECNEKVAKMKDLRPTRGVVSYGSLWRVGARVG